MAKNIKNLAASDKGAFSNKLYQTLLCLDDKALKRLSRFMESPYFVQSKILPSLLDALVVELEKSPGGFDKMEVWKKVFVDQVFDDVIFRKHCSDLLGYVQDFMAHEKLTEDPFLLSVKSLEYVVDKKIEPLFKSTIRKSREYINNTQFVSIKEHILGYLLEREYYTWMDFGVKVDVRSNLEEISKHLDMVYWIEKLKLSSWALSQRKTGNHQYQIRHSEELVQNLKDYPLDLIPELAIYYYSHLTLLDESEESHYYKLRNLLDQYGQSIPQDEAIGLFDSALNYCIGKINKGNHAFQIEYFELFEDILNKNIFIVNGELATWRFNNMVAAALRLDKLDWAESFIQKYHIYLSPESRANTYSFNLARVYRFQGKYSEVIKILQNVEYEDIGHNLISKAVLLITYYELQEFETLLHFTTAFRTFLNRHKNIPAARRQGYLNLIKYTRRLIRLDFSDAAAVARLREEITREKASTINHEWLLEKLSGTSR